MPILRPAVVQKMKAPLISGAKMSNKAVVSEIDNGDVAAVGTSRGANCSSTEDLCLEKAFVSASEDAVVGANKRTKQFKTKFHENCKRLIDTVNSRGGHNCGCRTIGSALDRFQEDVKART